MTKTLCLILAAGRGERARKAGLLNEHEPVKPMIIVDGKRLVDYAIEEVKNTGQDVAVLSYPAEPFNSLDEHVAGQGVKVLKQRAKQRSLPMPLRMPHVVLTQYHFSQDSSYLKSFDSIMVMPSDQAYTGVDFAEFVKFHYAHLNDPKQEQVTVLAKDTLLGGRTELFKMEGERIVGWKTYKGKDREGYVKSTQAGIYILSKGILDRPWALYNALIFRYATSGDWSNLDNKAIEKKAI